MKLSLVNVLILLSIVHFGYCQMNDLFVMHPAYGSLKKDGNVPRRRTKYLINCLQACQNDNECIGFNINLSTEKCSLIHPLANKTEIKYRRTHRYYQREGKCNPDCGASAECLMDETGNPRCRCLDWPHFCGNECNTKTFALIPERFVSQAKTDSFENVTLKTCKAMCLHSDQCYGFNMRQGQRADCELFYQPIEGKDEFEDLNRNYYKNLPKNFPFICPDL